MKLYKPKFWDGSINIYSIILYPLSLFYKILFFFKKLRSATKFKISVICVGNIYLGGTGKTPLSILLQQELKKIRNTVIIKKDYAEQDDEQKLIKTKNSPLIINKKRVDAIKQAEKEGYDIAILDDGYQDFSIKKDISILCFNARQLIGNGLLLPAGPLRESLKAIQRARVVVINGNKEKVFEEKLLEKSKELEIFYSKYVLDNTENFKGKKFLAFAGIGNPVNFFDILQENNITVKKSITFPDHYKYSRKELEDIISEARKNDLEVLTTEKDYERIKNFNFNEIDYASVHLKIDNKDKLINLILKYLK
tara:strand:+ start:750 stop:1676 length:927 start_codon:yes stop_codon:yes gene_type:complete